MAHEGSVREYQMRKSCARRSDERGRHECGIDAGVGEQIVLGLSQYALTEGDIRMRPAFDSKLAQKVRINDAVLATRARGEW
eukprot:13135696-Alexandrium_andersonii.AAC.1